MLSRNCQTCKAEFFFKKYRINTAKYCSISCSMTGKVGPESRAWRGGKSLERELWQGSKACKDWRKAVYIRDNFACVLCKASADDGVRLNADHIKPWAYFPELRADVNNGRTLCVSCHKQTDTYGSKAKVLAAQGAFS